MATSLKIYLRKRIFDDIVTPSKKSKSEFLVMVADNETIKVVSSCCLIHQMNEAGVGVVLNVHYDREQMKVPVIYFLMPTRESVTHMIEDYKDKKHPMYTRAHIFFNGHVTSELMSLIRDAKNLCHVVKSFKEVFFDFNSIESRVFSLARPGTIPKLYFDRYSDEERDVEIDRTAHQIAALMVTLRELPHIRYFKGGKKSGINSRLAREIEKNVQVSIRELTDWKYREDRSTLLILDRTQEPVAPLMHEYTYQAMVADLLDQKGDEIILDERKHPGVARPILLNEEDPLWLEMRHKHIARVLEQISERYTKFLAENKVLKVRGQNASDLTSRDIQEAMRNIPQYKKECQFLSTHYTVADCCMQLYTSKNMKDLSTLEQDMATGLNDKQKSTNLPDIEKSLTEMIKNKNISVHDKLRLLMIYMITQDGINEGTRKRLFQAAKFQKSDEDAVLNLYNLGVSLQQSSTKHDAKKYSKEELKRNADHSRGVPLKLMRYLPSLHFIIEQHYNGDLPREKYPYLTEPPPDSKKQKRSKKVGRSHRVRRAGLRGGQEESKENDEGDPRLIIFVVGGVTYSEIRTVYELCKDSSNDIIIGSTSILTAKEYIQDLSDSLAT